MARAWCSGVCIPPPEKQGTSVAQQTLPVLWWFCLGCFGQPFGTVQPRGCRRTGFAGSLQLHLGFLGVLSSAVG